MATFQTDITEAKTKRLLTREQKREVIDWFKANPNIDYDAAVKDWAHHFRCSEISIHRAIIDEFMRDHGLFIC